MLQPLNRIYFQPQAYGGGYQNMCKDARKVIDHYSYGLTEEIGRGCSSKVYKGRDEKTQQPVAVKVIDMKMIQQSVHATLLKNEINALKSLNQKNILQLYDVFQTQNNTYIITEFCDSGDLNALLKQKGQISEAEAIRILSQICNGLLEMSKKSFIHRDIKPANILLDKNIAKIADFGFAIQINQQIKNQGYNVGTPLYMSPQVLRQQGHSEKGDVWAVGVMYFEMLFGRTPFNGCSEAAILSIILNKGLSIPSLPSISELSKDFIRRCLIIDDSKRCTIKEMCAHKLMTSELSIRSPLLQLNQNHPSKRSQSFHKEYYGKTQKSEQQIQLRSPIDINFMKQLNSEKDLVGRSRGQRIVFDPKGASPYNNSFDNNLKQAQIPQMVAPPTIKFKANNDLLFSQINFCRFLYKFLQQLSLKGLKLSSQLQDKMQFLIAKNIAVKISKLQSINEASSKENVFGLEDLENYKKSESYQKFALAIWEYSEKYLKHFQKIYKDLEKEGFNHFE